MLHIFVHYVTKDTPINTFALFHFLQEWRRLNIHPRFSKNMSATILGDC